MFRDCTTHAFCCAAIHRERVLLSVNVSLNLMSFCECPLSKPWCFFFLQYTLRGFDLIHSDVFVIASAMILLHQVYRAVLCPPKDEHAEVTTPWRVRSYQRQCIHVPMASPIVNRSTLIQVRRSRGGDPVTVMPYLGNGAEVMVICHHGSYSKDSKCTCYSRQEHCDLSLGSRSFSINKTQDAHDAQDAQDAQDGTTARHTWDQSRTVVFLASSHDHKEGSEYASAHGCPQCLGIGRGCISPSAQFPIAYELRIRRFLPFTIIKLVPRLPRHPRLSVDLSNST